MEPDPDEDTEALPNSDKGVLSPQDLEPDKNYSVEIDDGRYVVSSTGKPDVGSADESELEDHDSGRSTPNRSASEEPTAEDPLPNSEYSYSITLSVEGNRLETTVAHDDVSDSFAEYVAAYVDLLSEDTPKDEAIGLLLHASSVDVKIPSAALEEAVRSLEVSKDDSVENLIEAARDSGGFPLRSE